MIQGWILEKLARLEAFLDGIKRRFLPAPVVLFRDVTAPWLASALSVAAELQLAERLDDGVFEVDALAVSLDLPRDDLQRLLKILEAHGYFRLTSCGRVVHTSLSRALRRDVGGAFALLQGSSWYRQAFLPEVVLAGWRQEKTPFEATHGHPFFEYLGNDSPLSTLFSGAMSNITRFCSPYLVDAIALRPGERYLDVGGSGGELARALLARYPDSAIEVLDRIQPLEATAETTRAPKVYQGDLFDPYPTDFDGVLLKNILHDWPDHQALEILRHCRASVSPEGRLFVVECLLPNLGDERTTRDSSSFALDWNVWLTLSGKERSLLAYQGLLERAGWKKVAVRKTATPYQVIEAVAI